MSKKLTAIKNALTNNHRNSRYGFLVSFVALIEVVMILIVSTFAWVETISSIEIQSDNWKIDTYTFTRAEIGTDSGFSGSPIDLASYINESGNVHMASASSCNGKDFYFPEIASATNPKFRKGNLNDKNTNYISFSLKVKAVGSSASFYFSSGGPEFKIGDNVVEDNSVRCAISVADDENATPITNVYSMTANSSEEVVASTDGTASTITAIRSFRDYDKSNEKNALFTLEDNQEKLITVTLWLQDPNKTEEYAGKKLTSSNFQIVTGTVSTVIEFRDRTSRFNDNNTNVGLRENTWQWIANDKAKMWVRTAAGKNFELTQSATDPTLWSVSIADQNMGPKSGTLTFYRTKSSVTSNPQNAGDNIYNTWTTKLSDASSTDMYVYTAYGNTKSGKEGYGTWKSVSQIQLYSDNADVLPTSNVDESCDKTHITMKNTANDIVEMNYNNGFWQGFVPMDDTSKNLTFSFSYKETNYTIDAKNRDITQDVSKYGVTSETTGYWEDPATVQALVGDKYKELGSASVTGGKKDANRVKVTKGTDVQFLATAKSEDYAFDGWYSNADCTELVSKDNPKPYTANNVNSTYTLYAKFLNNIRLTAVTKGGSLEASNSAGTVRINSGTAGKTASAPVESGASVTLEALLNDSENYSFTGWYDTDGHKLYTESYLELTNVTTPLNLEARFEVLTFTLDAYAMTNGENNTIGGSVKFEGQEFYQAHANITVAYTDSATIKYTAEGTSGYDFKGWYKGAACSEDQLISTKPTITINKKTTQYKFYAKFERRKYEINAYPVTNDVLGESGGTVTVSEVNASPENSSTGKPAKIEAYHGNKVKFTAAPANGYAFVGWYTSLTGGNPVSTSLEYTYPEGDENGITGAYKLYGRFKKQFKISLIAYTDGVESGTGGTVKAGSDTAGATSEITVLQGDSVTIEANPKTEYLFTEWKDSTSNKTYGTDTSATISNVTSDYKIIGHFKIKQFTVSAVAKTDGSVSTDGGTVEFTSPISGSGASVTVNYGESVTFKANISDADLYEFKGWFENADLSGDPKSTALEYTYENITSDKTLYAKFVLKEYTVIATVVSNGVLGSSTGGEIVRVENSTEQTPGSNLTLNIKHGTSLTLKAKPVNGATFEGWYSAATGGTRLDVPANKSLTFEVTGNMEIYARFTVTNKPTIIYFQERKDFSKYYAYIYDEADNNKHPVGDWPGKALETKDPDTGYYKLTFTTPYSGNFRAIVNNGYSGNGNQYPTDKGLEGTYGKTYLFGESEMKEYTPISVTLGAVTVNLSGDKPTDGFTGGSITVDGTDYTEAKTFTRGSGTSFTATANRRGNYKFAGWYVKADCTGDPVSTNATLSLPMTENKIYYAKFVEEAVSNITITFVDNTTNHWASEQGKVYLKDNKTGTVYNSKEDGYSNHQATFTVPSTVTDITFYRYKDGYQTSDLWSTISAGNRGTSVTYTITSASWEHAISGSWS